MIVAVLELQVVIFNEEFTFATTRLSFCLSRETSAAEERP